MGTYRSIEKRAEVHDTLLLPPAMVVLALSRLFLGRKEEDGADDGLGAVDLDHFVRSLNERLDGEEEETALDNELQILQNALDFERSAGRPAGAAVAPDEGL